MKAPKMLFNFEQMAEKITMYTDGGSRGNPGPAAVGVYIESLNKKIGQCIGIRTNNDAEYEALHEIASLYPEIIDISQFTEPNFRKAFTICVTRCFGWSLPSTMVVPFADCANHFIIDNQYELFNSNLHKITDKTTVSDSQQKYFTQIKMRINCYKHFTEDDGKEVENFQEISDPNFQQEFPYKTKRYIRKLKMREECLKI